MTEKCDYRFPELYFRVGILDIVSGKKIETRRPFTDTNFYYFSKMIGRIVKATDGTRNTFILVVDVYREKLGEVDDVKARREGFKNLDEFKDAWRRIYGAFNPEQDVVVITFVHFACEEFCPSRQRISVDGVEVPLCRGVIYKKSRSKVAIASKCAFCWLAPIKWCGNCIHGVKKNDMLVCTKFGVSLDRIRLPERLMDTHCEFYARSIPEHIRKALSVLKEKGAKRIE